MQNFLHDDQKKSVLIIGARGFTGQHLVRELQDDWITIDSRDHGLDLIDPASIRFAIANTKPDAIVNLGAIATLAETNRDSIFDVNAFGVLNLIEALRDISFTGRLVIASSAYIYGLLSDKEPTPETQPPRPHNLYACAKALAEHFCNMHSKDMDIVVVRPFNAIGRGHRNTFLVPKIVKHFRERASHIELGNTNIARSYSDIRDVGRMYRAVLEADTPPTVLNFCNPQVVTIDAILACLTELTGHQMKVILNPSFIRSNDVLYQCGTTNLLEKLGFKWKYELRDTLQWMLEE